MRSAYLLSASSSHTEKREKKQSKKEKAGGPGAPWVQGSIENCAQQVAREPRWPKFTTSPRTLSSAAPGRHIPEAWGRLLFALLSPEKEPTTLSGAWHSSSPRVHLGVSGKAAPSALGAKEDRSISADRPAAATLDPHTYRAPKCECACVSECVRVSVPACVPARTGLWGACALGNDSPWLPGTWRVFL